MKILLAEQSTNYRLIDSGDYFKLEQFGVNKIIRPDSNCVWKRSLPASEWNQADAIYTKTAKGDWTWQIKKTFKEPWLFTYQLPATGAAEKPPKVVCQLRLSQSRNIGIFPEQTANWSWIADQIDSSKATPHVLNLFGYTGGASLAAAAAGADVCHVDASQPAITLAKENQGLSKLNEATIRWIVDDCAKFVAREIKREVVYDALIIDPPAFGRDQKGKMFEFEKHTYDLLVLCKKVLKPKPLFVLFNGYSMGFSATVLKNILSDIFPTEKIEFGELHIPQDNERHDLPCSLFARFGRAR